MRQRAEALLLRHEDVDGELRGDRLPDLGREEVRELRVGAQDLEELVPEGD